MAVGSKGARAGVKETEQVLLERVAVFWGHIKLAAAWWLFQNPLKMVKKLSFVLCDFHLRKRVASGASLSVGPAHLIDGGLSRKQSGDSPKPHTSRGGMGSVGVTHDENRLVYRESHCLKFKDSLGRACGFEGEGSVQNLK